MSIIIDIFLLPDEIKRFLTFNEAVSAVQEEEESNSSIDLVVLPPYENIDENCLDESTIPKDVAGGVEVHSSCVNDCTPEPLLSTKKQKQLLIGSNQKMSILPYQWRIRAKRQTSLN